MADRGLHITPHESVVVLDESPEALEVEGRWAPGASAPPKHFHPAQDERFEVLAGTLTIRLDGRTHDLAEGDTLDVPRGGVHQVFNAGAVEARARWRTTPAGRTRRWFETLDRHRRSGRLDRKGMPGPLAFGVYLTEYRDVFRPAGPQPILRGVLAALGLVGRLRGYRV